MFTLDYGTIRTCVDALELDLERWRREAARERLLHGLEAERTPDRRTDRPSWHRGRHGTPHPSGAH